MKPNEKDKHKKHNEKDKTMYTGAAMNKFF